MVPFNGLMIAFLCCLFACNSGQQSHSIHFDKNVVAQVDEYFNALTKLNRFNGVVLVVHHGKTLLEKAYNIDTNSTNKLYVTCAHQFDLRSISKLIAKCAIVQLQQQGKLHVDSSVSKYVANFPNGDYITIQQLLDHQAGFPREFADDELPLFSLKPKEIVELIKSEPLAYEPGSDTVYSNLGYQLVYYIIQEVGGKPFAQYVQDEIFDPLGMKNSGAHFYTNRNNLNQFAFYHTVEDDRIVLIDHLRFDSKRQAKLYATTEDLKKLLLYLRENPQFSHLQNAKGAIGHSGGSEGIRTHIQTHVEKRYSFIFLANYDAIPIQQIIDDVTSIIEEKPYNIPQQVSRKSIVLKKEDLIKFEGQYRFKDINNIVLNIKLEGDQLVAYQDGELAGRLIPESKHVFFSDPEDEASIEFVANKTGSYTMLMDFKGAKWKGEKIEVGN